MHLHYPAATPMTALSYEFELLENAVSKPHLREYSVTRSIDAGCKEGKTIPCTSVILLLLFFYRQPVTDHVGDTFRIKVQLQSNSAVHLRNG
jgi:hypothetical protein